MKPLTGRIEVLTFKDGILSKVAHDLLIELGRFELRTDGTRVEGRFALTSLSVEGVMHKGVLDAHGLSDGDRHDIEGNIQGKILHTKDNPEATFVGQGAPSGELIEEALQTALRDLILPGLETLSLPVAPLAAWLAEGAPTASS